MSYDFVTIQIILSAYLVKVVDIDGFGMFDGVKLKNNSNTHVLDLSLVPETFGDHPKGYDGGCFVEFIDNKTGNDNIPKYTLFPIDGDMRSMNFCDYWFDNSGDLTNIFQLVAAVSHADNSLGTAKYTKNIQFITIENHKGFTNFLTAVSETIPHELGHQFVSLRKGANVGIHVDNTVAILDHTRQDTCIMSYLNDEEDGTVEFDLDCLYDVRTDPDPM